MNSSPHSKSRPFRIAWIPTSNGGVNYTRMASWAFEMRKYRNVETAVFAFTYSLIPTHPWQRDIISIPQVREDIECLARASDAMIWQPIFYEHTMQFFNEIRQKYGKPMFIETDDNYVDVPPWNEAQRSFGPGSSHRYYATEAMSWADGMFTTTPYLKDLYSKFNENIHIIPNSLDFKGDRKFVGWDKVSVRKHKGIRIGWIGGRSHFEDLMMVAPALREILEKYPEVTLVLVNSAIKPSCEAHGIKYPFEGIPNEQIHYADRSVPINRYAQFMASFGFDIGIAPLVDCNFNRAKSNLRWLEYSALSLPSVCTDISHFSQTVRNGVDGFLVKDLQEWVTKLGLLIRDKNLRENMGKQAYKRVKKDFNLKNNAPHYVRLLKKLSDFNVYTPEYIEQKDSQHDLARAS